MFFFFFSFCFGFGLHRGLLPLAAVIGLLHLPQLVCHASWATRTTLTAAATTSTDTSPVPASASAPTTTPAPNLAPSAVPSMQIQRLQVNCSREMLDMQLLLSRPFRGLLYAKDFPLECRSRGKDSTHLQLRIPTSGCGVRADPLADGGIEYTVRVMLQMEQKLRQSTDILSSVRCQLPAKAMGMPLPGVPGVPLLRTDNGRERNARMRALAAASAIHVASSSSSSSTVPSAVPQHNHHHHHHNHNMDTPRVRIWLELGGPNGTGSVEVGVPTTLTVRAIVPGTIGVRVVDCAALDGLGESTQQLLDARGCPIDEQVMPALHTHHKPAEEGWSKQHEEDLVERTFAATFPAFKFPDRERLHVSCGVQLCKGKCPNLNCRLAEQQQQLQLSADQHLARIEVFNSLAVTAPQIEVDRLRHDRRYNMSVEDYAPHVRPLPGEGTLCLSISKLAISFCILGLIFLVAVVVAIFSLIRTRRRERRHGARLGFGLGLGLGSGTGTGTGLAGTSTSNSSSRLHRDRADICTSMFSSSSESAQSQPRFGAKFLMPYYPNALPYGRVY